MTTDRDETRLIRSWLDETYESERGGQPFLDRMLDEIPTTQQRRRRWWPLPSLRRSTAPLAADQTIDYLTRSAPATNGHTPTVTGRTRSMFSPAKAITAGALVFALGGVLLVAQPFDQPGGSVPGAATDVAADGMAAAWITGTMKWADGCEGGEPDPQEARIIIRGHRCAPQVWTSDDPRFGGTGTSIWNSDQRIVDGDWFTVTSMTVDVRGESGGWVCGDAGQLILGPGATTDFSDPVQGSELLTCTGDGDNSGLTAILVLDQGPTTTGAKGSGTIEGLIFEGDVPPLPEVAGE